MAPAELGDLVRAGVSLREAEELTFAEIASWLQILGAP
jgi:hypothetical protein